MSHVLMYTNFMHPDAVQVLIHRKKNPNLPNIAGSQEMAEDLAVPPSRRQRRRRRRRRRFLWPSHAGRRRRRLSGVTRPPQQQHLAPSLPLFF